MTKKVIPVDSLFPSMTERYIEALEKQAVCNTCKHFNPNDGCYCRDNEKCPLDKEREQT